MSVQSAADIAYVAIKQRVLLGEYPGGELISEGEVAEAVGLSRTPVREAFVRLQSAGLLKLYPKRGALVVPVTMKEIEEVFEARQVVETFAVGKVLITGNAAGLGLAELITAQQALVEASQVTAFAQADRDFHSTVVAAADNDIVAGLYESLRDRQLRMSLLHVTGSPERLHAVVAEHRAIADALCAGDSVAAHASVRLHLENTRAALRRSRPDPGGKGS